MNNISLKDRNRIGKIEEVIRKVSEIDAEMPLGQIRFFLAVARGEGSSLREIAAQCDLLMGTASRYMANLMFIPKYRQNAGVSLIHAYDNPVDRRQKVIILTPAGKKLVEGLIEGV